LNETETKAIYERLIERSVKRRQFILQEGDVCQHYTFVVNGCFKMYKVDTDGKEQNLKFAVENEWKIARYMFNKTAPKN